MAEAGRRGPGCAVREQGEQKASPLDQSWLLLHQNDQGHIVEEKDGRCVSDGGGKREGKAKRPTELFEKGSMVEVKGYGYGVVQWMGELEGRNTAGVELVSKHTHTHTSATISLSLSLVRRSSV